MKHIFTFFLALFCLLPCMGAQESYTDKVVIIEVGPDSLVNRQSFKFWRRTLQKVNTEKAQAVIFQIDSPGGLAFDTLDIMVNELRDLSVPSYAFVDKEATSAGALIAIATDEIWMTPGSTIGAAAIVDGSGAPIEATMRAKLESFFDANIRAVTRDKGHPTEIVKMMMFIEEKPRRYGPVKVEKGALLTLTAEEAVEIYEERPILAKGIVADRDSLIAKLSFNPSEVVVATPTGFERFASYVSIFSSLLILIGIGGIYFEMKSPGFGLGAGVAITAFAIFFFGNFVAGNLAGYELIALFLLGLILIIAEVMIIPGFFVGIIGAIMMISSLLLAMVNRLDFSDIGKIDLLTGDKVSAIDVFAMPMLNLALGLIGGCLLIMLLMRYLPKVHIPGIILSREIGAGGSVDLSPEQEDQTESLVGQTGVALMDLKPGGKVKLTDRSIEVLTNGAFISAGTRVRITQHTSMKTIVEAVETTSE